MLIDYQKEMFDSIRSETPADLVELHARLLAKTAMAFKMPIVEWYFAEVPKISKAVGVDVRK